jgi:uncharacterized integral membrane protein (TIGR00698 family)
MKRILLNIRNGILLHTNRVSWWCGVALASLIGVVGIGIAQVSWFQQLGLSALTIAIIAGIVVGNTFFPAISAHTSPGVDFSRNQLLRAGVVLYGFRITFQQITGIGWAGLVIDVLIVSMTFAFAVLLGTRVFKMDRQMVMLIGAGASICGAAAVMATESVVKASSHKVAVAVATVVVFGTLSMFIYPLIYPYLGMTEHMFGIYAGSTIHEVAQVVVAGRSVGDLAASTAVIEKMMRVMMLAPFLLLLSIALRKYADPNIGYTQGKQPLVIPWFAVLFVATSAINSLRLIPADLIKILVEADNILLATAMAALGLRTHASAIRQAGGKPLLLATVLFVFLIVAGYAINRIAMHFLTAA